MLTSALISLGITLRLTMFASTPEEGGDWSVCWLSSLFSGSYSQSPSYVLVTYHTSSLIFLPTPEENCELTLQFCPIVTLIWESVWFFPAPSNWLVGCITVWSRSQGSKSTPQRYLFSVYSVLRPVSGSGLHVFPGPLGMIHQLLDTWVHRIEAAAALAFHSLFVTWDPLYE